MSTAKPLRIETAYGTSLATTVLVASHPDETHDAYGDPRPDARSFVLTLQGDRARLREERPVPLTRSAYSPTSGTAYFGSVARNVVFRYAAGRWSEEVFTSAPVDFVRSVYVWPGATAADDTVFVTSRSHVYVRSAGAWQEFTFPGEGFPLQMVGSAPDQIYIGGSELCLWDGQGLVELDSPPNDTTGRLAISADDRLIAGSHYLHASTDEGGWEQLASPFTSFFALASLNDRVYALSDEDGVLSVYPGPVTKLTRTLDARGLVAVGDGLIAFGDDGAMAFDGQRWFDLILPFCEVGQQPY